MSYLREVLQAGLLFGQGDDKRGALAKFTLECNFAMVKMHDFLANSKANSSSLIITFAMKAFK